MVEMFTLITEIWTVPKTQLKNLLTSRIHHINHVFYFSSNPNIAICNIQLNYSYFYGFQLSVFSLLSKTIKFQYKHSNGIYYTIQKFSLYGENLFKTDNEELEIKVTGMHIFEANEYPTILRTGFDAEFFGLWENNDKDFEIIVGKNANKKIGQIIHVHKELLISQSPVFEAMFRSGMEEEKTNTLKIIEFKYETVKAAIDFFCGHDIFTDLDLNDVFELFRLADKYDIDELRDCLETYCTFLVSPSNVYQIANISIQIYLMKLQKYCKTFIEICRKHSVDIKDSAILDKEFSAEIWKKTIHFR